MKKTYLLLTLFFVAILNCFSQSKAAFDKLTTPIGRNIEELKTAALESGYAIVNSDENGRTVTYELINKKNENFRCQLNVNNQTKKCYSAAFSFPLSAKEQFVNNLNKTGERQGVYYQWKFPAKGYEIVLSDDTDKQLMFVFMKMII